MTSRKRAVFELTHPHAAGIDMGAASHFVAVPPDRDDSPVPEFPSFSGDLERLADWLAACDVDTVAMESTGVYWIPLFEWLESKGLPSIGSMPATLRTCRGVNPTCPIVNGCSN